MQGLNVLIHRFQKRIPKHNFYGPKQIPLRTQKKIMRDSKSFLAQMALGEPLLRCKTSACRLIPQESKLENYQKIIVFFVCFCIELRTQKVHPADTNMHPMLSIRFCFGYSALSGDLRSSRSMAKIPLRIQKVPEQHPAWPCGPIIGPYLNKFCPNESLPKAGLLGPNGLPFGCNRVEHLVDLLRNQNWPKNAP